MKLRKLVALLMAAAMLLGMVPVSYAEIADIISPTNCSHDWQTSWPNGKPANCQDWKIKRYTCALCGSSYDNNECGSCVAGSRQWILPQGSNCQEYGAWEILCKYCGECLDTGEEPGPHKWKTETVEQPTCLESGTKETTCSVCGSEKGDPEKIPALGHNWGGWKLVGSADCTKAGKEERTCSRCGATESRDTKPGDHKWGEWKESRKPNCTDKGEEARTCSVCGKKETRQTNSWGHAFDEWEIIKEPTCQELGRKTSTCKRCKEDITYNMPTVDHIFGEWYVVTQPQVGEPGLEQRDCTFGCGTNEQREIPALTEMEIPQMWCSIGLVEDPANGTHFVPGETAYFSVAYENPSDYDVINARIYGLVQDTPVHNDGNELAYNMPIVDAPVASHGFGSFTVSYTVTEADAARGAIYAEAGFWADLPNGIPVYEYITVPMVAVPCGAAEGPEDIGLTSALSIIKNELSTPGNGSYYVPGEIISFKIVLTNTSGDTLYNVEICDPLMQNPVLNNLAEMNPGAQMNFAVLYRVTDFDAAYGAVVNTAHVSAIDAVDNRYLEYSNTVTVPCGFPDGNDPFGTFHSVAVVKKEESLPQNGQYYTEGEVIHYSITYTNDGEQPLTNVDIWDVMDVLTPVASAETLQPGESRVCYYQHTVTAADVAAGSVMNIAHANYPIPNVSGFANSCSNAVFSKTSADGKGLIPLPLFPLPGEDSGYTPGTGWFHGGVLIPEGGAPLFGTIDTDALHSGDSYCHRTITGRDNASVSYETTFCAVHSPIQASVLTMTQTAASPETQMQAAAYASALWRTEVQKLYQKIHEASDPTAKAVVMTEYVRFLTDIANYDAMLKVLYPDQPALAAMKVAAAWENKCIDLCCDAHAAAADRKDSLLAVTLAAGASNENCTCAVTAQEAGRKADVQGYCPMHAFPFSMTDALLQGRDTAEAWTMVRQIWGVELTSAYNRIYTAMGENKLLAMAEHNALIQWMMAREASLIALYPDNPELVVQLMVKTIMDRVNALCQMVE